MKKIILIDFSKVISAIGISTALSLNLEKYLNLNQEEIRNIYKKNIGKLVIGKYSIFQFLDELKGYIKQGYKKDDIEKQIYKIPTIDKNILDLLLVIKKDYQIYLVSDIYKELGNELKIVLSKYCDKFIFSFEEGYKKSQQDFWEKINKKINLKNCFLFIDDKQENILIAESYGIKGVLYDNFANSKSDILSHLYRKYDNITLGAGASGILYSYFLQKKGKENFLILEKEKDSLGLMKSYKIGNSYYDLGGHALHDKNEAVKKFLENEGNVLHYRQKRKAYIDYKNMYIPFPFQLHLNFLELNEKRECFEDFMKCYLDNKKIQVDNLDDLLKMKYGKGIYKYFLGDYNKKIWKTDLKKIGTNWKERISYEDLETFLYGYLEKNDTNYGTNNYVNYPSRGGYQEYLTSFYENIKDKVIASTNIRNIDIKNKIVETNYGKFIYKNLISTIPLNELISLTNVNMDKNIFKYLSLQIVAILIKKTHLEHQRIYNKDKKYFFHKCVLNSNSSEFLKSQDEFVIQFENSFKNGKKANKDELIHNCIHYLLEKEIINSQNDVLDFQYREVKYGYPIQTINIEKKKQKIKNEFEKYSIYLLGRFGYWDYINFDKVILNTIKLFNEKEQENIII